MKSIDERIKEHIRRNCHPQNSRNTRDAVLEYIKKNGGRRVPTLYVNNIPDNFYLYLNDESLDNPFVISSALADTIQKEVRGLGRAQDKSRRIYDWMINNIKYGKNGRMVIRTVLRYY